MGRAKFGEEHQAHNFKVARKNATRARKQAEREQELAEWRGFNVKRMNAASIGKDATGKGKPHKCKIEHKSRWSDGSTRNGESRIVRGKAYNPEGTFVQFGARTKEGQLEQKQRSETDKRKVWKQGYTIASQRFGVSLHDHAGLAY